MKKLFSFILTGTILASSCMICYGGTATLNKENEETSFDIYATYEPGENDYFSARVEADGTCEIELPNGIRISVQDVTQENLTLIVYLIPVQDEDAWEWFTACMNGRGTRILPFEIYFEDETGTRIPADKVPVQITLPETCETVAVFALDDIPAEDDTPEITLPDTFTHPAANSNSDGNSNRDSNPDANKGANSNSNPDADSGTNANPNKDTNQNSKPDPIPDQSPIRLTNPVSDRNPRQPDRKRHQKPIHRRPNNPGKMDGRNDPVRHRNSGGIQEKERK